MYKSKYILKITKKPMKSFARNGKLSRVANRRKISGNFSITLHLLYCTLSAAESRTESEYSKSDPKNLLDFYYFLPILKALRLGP